MKNKKNRRSLSAINTNIIGDPLALLPPLIAAAVEDNATPLVADICYNYKQNEEDLIVEFGSGNIIEERKKRCRAFVSSEKKKRNEQTKLEECIRSNSEKAKRAFREFPEGKTTGDVFAWLSHHNLEKCFQVLHEEESDSRSLFWKQLQLESGNIDGAIGTNPGNGPNPKQEDAEK